MTRALRLSEEQLAAHQARMRNAGAGYAADENTKGRTRPDVRSAVGSSPAPAPNKHGAVPTSRGELRFDSKHEARVWDDLCTRELAGEITHLQRQVRFPFTTGGRGARVTVGWYKADFVYRTPDGTIHVADAKSKHTRKLPGWHRTKQLMLALYGVEVDEL